MALKSAVIVATLIGVGAGTTQVVLMRPLQCKSCRIQAAAVIALKDPRAEPVLESRVARDARGRYFVAPIAQKGRIGVFTANGLHAVIGKSGRGPGEFREINTIAVSPHDSLWVIDLDTRISVFTPALQFARTFMRSSDFIPGTPLIEEPTFIASRRGVSSNLPDAGIRLFRTDGVPILDFGERLNYNDRSYPAIARVGSEVWAIVDSPAEIDVFDKSGRLVRTYERAVRGLRPWSPSMRRIPYFAEIAAGRDSIIWLMGRIYRHEQSGGGASEEPVAAAVRQPSVSDQLDSFDYYLEAMNARSGKLIARARVPNRLPLGFLSDDQFYALSEDEDGDVQLEVWKLTLIER